MIIKRLFSCIVFLPGGEGPKQEEVLPKKDTEKGLRMAGEMTR